MRFNTLIVKRGRRVMAATDRDFRRTLNRIAATIRRIIGAPDYDAYLVHQRSCHPEQVPLTPDAFAQDTLTRRYQTPGNRCC